MIDKQINDEIDDENNDDFQRGLPSLPTSWQSRKGGLIEQSMMRMILSWCWTIVENDLTINFKMRMIKS